MHHRLGAAGAALEATAEDLSAALAAPAVFVSDVTGHLRRPAALSAPVITGRPVPGQVLTAYDGVWTGAPSRFHFIWRRCAGRCQRLKGARGTTYVVTRGDLGRRVTLTVEAVNAAGTGSATALLDIPVATARRAAGQPINSTAPSISGQPVVGSTLNASRGSWSGYPTSYKYQWYQCAGTCSGIAGATSSSYVVAAGDAAHTLVAAVTASNTVGAATAVSAPTAAVTGPPPVTTTTTPTTTTPTPTTTTTTPTTTTTTPTTTTTTPTTTTPVPANTAAPTITGSAAAGEALTAAQGTWANSPASYAYQWEECDSSGSACAPIAGATASTLMLPSTAVGHTVELAVTATNAGGSATASSSPTSVIAPAGGSGVTFTPIDGGSNYFAAKSTASAWLDSHVLLGGWMEQPQSLTEVGDAVAMGENLYWSLAGQPGQNVVDYNVIRQGGMHVQAISSDLNTGSETVGWQGSDETDLDFGPGSGVYNNTTSLGTQGGSCATSTSCGYSAASFFYKGTLTGVTGNTSLFYPIDGRESSQGFSKGVLFFETASQAAQFLQYSDILSADAYWLTDTSMAGNAMTACAIDASSSACGNWSGPGLTLAQTELPANYGWIIHRLANYQALNGASKPIVADVETGCPGGGSNAGNCATPPQSIAAAWQALIAGARGIIWFQHNMSGPCVDGRTLIDGSSPASSMYSCQQTPGVTLHDLVVAITAFDNEVQSLNGVLLSPTASGYVHTTGDVSTMAKAYNGACYVFAGSGQVANPPAANQSVTLSLTDGYSGPVTVYDEGRTVQATNGTFTDTFADANAVHVYEIPGSAC